MQTKNDMRQLFQDNPRVSLRAAAVETSIAHATIWNFSRKELVRFPYNLRNAKLSTEGHEMRREIFAQFCRCELRNDAWYLDRIISSVNSSFLCPDQ